MSGNNNNNNNNTDQHDALMELLAPDGYYTYLGLDKATVVTLPSQGSNNNKVGEIDKEAVKKAYRKLSRKHHPDKGRLCLCVCVLLLLTMPVRD